MTRLFATVIDLSNRLELYVHELNVGHYLSLELRMHTHCLEVIVWNSALSQQEVLSSLFQLAQPFFLLRSFTHLQNREMGILTHGFELQHELLNILKFLLGSCTIHIPR